MKLPFIIGNRPIQGNFDALMEMLGFLASLRVAVAYVVGGGGSTYTLQQGYGIASVSGIATGQCRLTLSRAAAGTTHVFPFALVSDNAGWATGGGVVSVATVDIYVANSTTGALTNRSFWALVLYKAA